MTRKIVALSRWERKERMGHGAQKEIAAIAQCDPALVSRVVNGRQRHDLIERLITARIGRPGEFVFPPRESARQQVA